jgi:hypothetical protein
MLSPVQGIMINRWINALDGEEEVYGTEKMKAEKHFYCQ